MSFNSNHYSTSIKEVQKDNNLRWTRNEVVLNHRGEFSKDRDRILYSKSFLRLRGKTQVFLPQKNDYIRTRLTHTLEVNQIAKTIALALGQNVELVEAIALGHDVGHTPFGHIGERTLKQLIKNEGLIPQDQKGFKHNLQALRLYCDLEKGADFPEISGLNLTKYVLWGIAHHSLIPKDEENPVLSENPLYDNYVNNINGYWSIEGLIVALADEIAQRHHDIEDSLLYNIVSRNKIIEKLSQFQPLFTKYDKITFSKLKRGKDTLDDPVFTSVYSRLVVNIYVVNAINKTKENLRSLCASYNINSQKDFINIKPTLQEEDYVNLVSFPQNLKELDQNFQVFLKKVVLSSYQAQAMDGKAEYIIRKLYYAFKDNPQQLPDTALKSFFRFVGVKEYDRSELKNLLTEQNKPILYRCIVDYIGGMTDRYAYDEYDRLYGTRVF